MQLRFARHDKSGEEHFNLLSAYHKSLRGSDPQGALYWMARMIEGGEDPMTIFRRAIAMAAEDVGLADPEALKLAVAARDAYHMLGAPEGYLPLAQMTIYLATAPKSNSSKAALGAALDAARESPAAGVPMHIRNAPTALMKELGYHRGYQYAHDSRRPSFRRNTSRTSFAARSSMSRGLSGSKRRSQNDWRGGSRCGIAPYPSGGCAGRWTRDPQTASLGNRETGRGRMKGGGSALAVVTSLARRTAARATWSRAVHEPQRTRMMRTTKFLLAVITVTG
jgi:hypothetical protein